MSRTISDSEFSVVDVETTGLFPQRSDRIVEIAVVRITAQGEIVDKYVTLVNPERDVGRTDLHGISPTDIKQAPTFSEISGDVLERLAGAVFAAHNARFDKSFVISEMARSGIRIPDFPFVCTMRLSSRIAGPGVGRKLSEVCRYFGVALEQGHSAEHDAIATARVLEACLAHLNRCSLLEWDTIGLKGELVPRDAWPSPPTSGRSWTRSQVVLPKQAGRPLLAQMIDQLPSASDADPYVNEYLALLDRVLEDRLVTPDEAELLGELSSRLGLSRNQAFEAHRRYLRDLAKVVLHDGSITELERKELDVVRRLLGLDVATLDGLLNEVNVAGSATRPPPILRHAPELVGKTVCFTGSSTCNVDGKRIERGDAENLARRRGMIPVRTVTKTLDFLVAADCESMSGKAQKARSYGVRILAESAFWQRLGIAVD